MVSYAISNFDFFFTFAASKPHRTHRPKKSGEREMQYAQFDLRDHRNYAPMRRVPQKKSKIPKKTMISEDELPIGMAYFDPDQNKDAFAPITYAPVLESTFSRGRKQKKYTANNWHEQSHDSDAEPTTMQSVQNIVVQPKPQHFIKYGTVEDVPTTIESFKPEEAKPNHVAPEMYKFTLDDAVIRPKNSKKSASKGPVTTTAQSFDELPSNIDVHTHFLTDFDTTQPEHITTEVPKYYYRHIRNNERNSSRIVRKIERGRPASVDDSGRYVSRQFRRVEAKALPVTTTENPLTETNGKDELQIKATVEKWPLPLQRYSTRSRNAPKRRLVAEPIARITPEQLTYETRQSLDVSPSYTKQRTQGINSAEDTSTTPMTPAAVPFLKLHRAQQTHFDVDVARAQRQSERGPLENNQAKYFQ